MAPKDHLEEDSDETDAVAPQLALLEERIKTASAAWIAGVTDESITPLVAALRDAAAAHERIATVLGDDATDSVRAYREALRSEVMEPFLERLSAARPGGALLAAHARLLDELSGLAVDLEEAVDRPEPDGLYEPDVSDSWIRRLRKMRVRGARQLQHSTLAVTNRLRRVAGRRRCESTEEVQHVPVAHLASFHVGVRLPVELQPDHEALCEAVGRAIAQAGRSATEHVHAVLEANEPKTARAENGVAVPEDRKRKDAASSVRAGADRFQRELSDAAETLADFHRLDGVDDKIEELAGRLRRDVYEAGSFMMEGREVERSAAIRQRVRDRDAQWSTWYLRGHERIGTLAFLLEFKERTVELASALVDDVLEAGLYPARNALSNGGRRLESLSKQAEKAFTKQVSADDVDQRLKRALEAVDRETLSVLREGRLVDDAQRACDEAAVALALAVERLPQRVELNVLGDDVDPDRPSRRVDLREHAARVFDALSVEKLRRTTDRIAAALDAAREEAEAVPGVLRFNLGTAVDDLKGDSDVQDSARELVVDGLGRSADVLESAAARLEEIVEPFRQDVHDVFEDGFSGLHERVRVEERVREQMLDLRTGAEAGARRVAVRASEQAQRAAGAARKAYRAGRQRVRQWVHLGQAAAGLAAVTEEERLETVEALADTELLLDRFPLVYQRLFTFDPVRDPSLLEGRAHDLGVVRRHVDRWQRGLTDALFLMGFHGSGLTSFLNVVRRNVLEHADVRELDLRHRMRTEEELVEALADSLGFDGEPLATFDALAEHLPSRGPSEPMRVCIIEHLEHLYLRQVGGSRLLRAFLMFVSRTDSRVLWIATVGDYGWQIIRKAEPAASSLVFVHPLTPITRVGIESIILTRHRRSGLPLRFEVPPGDANPLFSRRYRRARTDAERQEILRTDYFDRLHRASGQNIMLALYYWMRSVEMDEEEGVLRVRAVEPLRFGFLQTFDLEQAFTLKALLEHASLTVEEHSESFQVPVTRSIEIFEAFGNLLLIEPMGERHARSRFAFATLGEEVRYRVRPLLIHPIIQYLRGKNIFH